MCFEYSTKAEIVKGIIQIIKYLATIIRQNEEIKELMKKQIRIMNGGAV